jgi:hypothetical protein
MKFAETRHIKMFEIGFADVASGELEMRSVRKFDATEQAIAHSPTRIIQAFRPIRLSRVALHVSVEPRQISIEDPTSAFGPKAAVRRCSKMQGFATDVQRVRWRRGHWTHCLPNRRR